MTRCTEQLIYTFLEDMGDQEFSTTDQGGEMLISPPFKQKIKKLQRMTKSAEPKPEPITSPEEKQEQD